MAASLSVGRTVFIRTALLRCLKASPVAGIQSQQCCCLHDSRPRKWFPTTYTPRWNWTTENLAADKHKEALSMENKLFIENQEELLLRQSNSPLLLDSYPRHQWKERYLSTIRCGLIGIKIGVVPQWTVTGKRILCTMLQILDNHVIDYQTPATLAQQENCRDQWKKKGYAGCTVGAVSASPLNFSDEYNEMFEKCGIPPKRKVMQFVITEDAAIAPGTPLCVQHFRVGDYVDVQAQTIDMGFQGVLTRWGMKGGRASHGVTKSHRRIGSIGGGGDKGGIWKGKKMPGHMGRRWRRHNGLQVVRINTKYNVLYVKGPNLPGPPRAYVKIQDTVLPLKRLRLNENPPPMPTFYDEDLVPDTAENLYHESLFSYDDEFVSYEGRDPDSLYLHGKQYLLVGGTYDGKNHTYRRGAV